MNKRFSVIMLIIGILTFVGGATFFCLDFFGAPSTRDAEYLVNIGTWALKDDSGNASVIWHFTEIGKGTLTTNDHINDYDFLWTINGDQLTIETDWLYDLNDTFTYHLDQPTDTLTLTRGDTSVIFTPHTTE